MRRLYTTENWATLQGRGQLASALDREFANFEAAAVLPGFNGGHRMVLFGDSMTETLNTIALASSASYASSTGVLTIGSTGHQMATGWYVRLFNRTYAALEKGVDVPVTVIDANSFKVLLPAGLPGVPNGALSGNTQMRFYHWQAAQGFVAWFLGYSGWRFKLVYNGAQSGDTTAQALARLDADCLQYDPQVVLMQMPGINDLSDGNGPVQEEVIASNQRSLIDRITAAGAVVIALTMTPVATGEASGRATLQKMQSVARLNRWLKAYAQSLGTVLVVDAWKAVVDPTNTTGLAVANYLRDSPDSIHYSMRGGELVGRTLWTAVKNYYPSDFSTLPASVADSYTGSAVTLSSVSRSGNVVTATASAHGYVTGDRAKVQGGSGEVLNEWVRVTRVDANTVSFASAGADGAIAGTIYLGRNNNLFANPLLTTLDGTLVAPVSGTEATDTAALLKVQRIAGSGAAVASMVSRSDGLGKNQRLVITPAGSSDQFDIELDFTPATDTIPKSVAAGRAYIAECELSLTNVSGSNLTELRWNLSVTVDGATVQAYALNGYSDGAKLNSDIAAFHARTAPLTMPAGSVSNVKFMLVLSFSAAGTALTVDVGRIALRELVGID